MFKKALRNMLGITLLIIAAVLVLSYCQTARKWADEHVAPGSVQPR